MVSQEEIEKIFGKRLENCSGEEPDWYCKSSELTPEEQKWIWDNIPHESPDKTQSPHQQIPNANDSVKCLMVPVNAELSQSKHKVITELKKCNYRSSPYKIASLLEVLFSSYSSKPGHWLYIAQNWTPRVVSWVLNYMVKQAKTGRVTIENPAAYFTKLIKYRKKRKELRNTNGT